MASRPRERKSLSPGSVYGGSVKKVSKAPLSPSGRGSLRSWRTHSISRSSSSEIAFMTARSLPSMSRAVMASAPPRSAAATDVRSSSPRNSILLPPRSPSRSM